MIERLETDYLIVGAGAAAMAFADEVMSQSKTARIILVDRRGAPGGHWNDAYSFVTLHQPAIYYGVNSEDLGAGGDDLTSRDEIVAYYARVMEKFCATGRVRFFPRCDYQGDGRFKSLDAHGQEYAVTVRRRTVDGTYANVTVPSTRPPLYEVAEGMHVVPINALAELDRSWARFVVIGAGKTGMDAILWLLEIGTDPDRITWIMSRDVWLINRDYMIPGVVSRSIPEQMRVTALCKDVDDYFRRFEEAGWFLRIDPTVPTAGFRCATVNPTELEAMRRVRDVVRLGRVQRVDATEIVLDRGAVPTDANVLHVDCTADGLAMRPPRPVFDGAQITLQAVVFCQPTFGAAMIGNIEMLSISDERKNAMTRPTPHPMVPRDYFFTIIDMGENMLRWFPRQVPWLLRKRLSIMRHMTFWEKVRAAFGVMRRFYSATKAIERFIQAYEEADEAP